MKLKTKLLRMLPDRIYIKLLYKRRLGKKLNLKNPQTFNEKLQWLKLYDRKPVYVTMVDKYAVRKYVADKIGEQYIVPTFGIWNSFDEIDFNSLPDQFVLKCTHDCGSLVICTDKSTFDRKTAKERLERNLKTNYYFSSREWPYKKVIPRIIAEQYLHEEGKIVPEDYKVYCFGGIPKYIVVFHDRFNTRKEASETVYNVQWEPQSISLDEHFQISNIIEPKPDCLKEMLRCAAVLSEGLVQSRIDFYIINGKLKFGEITLFTASGLQRMIPERLDEELGKYIELPLKRDSRGGSCVC